MSGLEASKIFDLLGPSEMNRGRARHVLTINSSAQNRLTDSQREFIEAIGERSAGRPSVPPHPADHAQLGGVRNSRQKDADLTAVELAWLQRLPLDPKQITFDDAVQLASLSASIGRIKAPASARLIDSVWQPVKDIHDERVAKARFEHAKAAPQPMPSSTLDALTDTLAAKHPEVSWDALRIDARSMLNDYVTTRDREQEKAIERAERNLKEVRESIARRAEITPEMTA